MEPQGKHDEAIKREEEKLEQAYCRIGKLVVELRAAEETARELEGTREGLQSQIDYVSELEERVRRENHRREEFERDLETIARSVRDLEVLLLATRQRHTELEIEVAAQRSATHAAEAQLHETRERYTKLVEQNIGELTKCEEARAQNEALRTRHASLVQHGKDLLTQNQMSETTNARLMDSYTAIMQQNETLKKDMVTAGPQVQIYGNVALRDNSPEEPYAVLALDGTLLGTGMTQSHGWIAYGPIAGSNPEVDVRIGGVTRRVVTSPWTAATAASAAPVAAPTAPAAPERFPVEDLPGMAFALQTLAANAGR